MDGRSFCNNWERVTHEDDKRLKVYMPCDRVMRNIQNRHKCIKYINSFIMAKFQRKLRKFSENPLSGSQVLGPTFRVSGFRFLAPWPKSHLWDQTGPRSRVLLTALGLGSHFLNMPQQIHLCPTFWMNFVLKKWCSLK